MVFPFLAQTLCALAASGDEYWDSAFGVPGADGPVWAITVHGSHVYVGGSFTEIGGVSANNIAKWDGTNWSALGAGLTGGALPEIHTIAFVGERLYAGGFFTQAGSVGASSIATWDGINWTAVRDGVSGGVRALAVVDNSLFVGGSFSSAGQLTVNNIAKWDGTNWTPLGDGIVGTAVDSLAASDGSVYAGGRFTIAGGIGATNIAKWDGTNWYALGQGLRAYDGVGGENAIVRALLVTGTAIYAGGGFRLAGEVGATNIAGWDGTKWRSLAGGIDMSGEVYALVASGNYLYAGGFFGSAGGNAANDIAIWNSNDWLNLGSGIGNRNSSATVLALASNGNELYVGGGGITLAGANASTNLALWYIPYSLRLSQAGNQLSLRWPATGTNFVLDAKDNITATNWSEVSSSHVLHNNECVVTDTVAGPQKFYRLRKK